MGNDNGYRMSFQGNEAFKIDYGNGCTCEYTKSQ